MWECGIEGGSEGRSGQWHRQGMSEGDLEGYGAWLHLLRSHFPQEIILCKQQL